MSNQPSLAYNKGDERKVSDEEKTAWCVACTLSNAMKPCCNGASCPLDVVLRMNRCVREIHLQTLDLGDDPLAVETLWNTIPKQIWEAYHAYVNAK